MAQIDETKPEEIRRLADDGTGNLRSEAEIETALQSEFPQFGQVITNPGELPGDASIRATGYFTDPDDLKEWLEVGGMYSTAAGEYVPLSWVWLHEVYDEGLQEYTYQVYIEDDSGGE